MRGPSPIRAKTYSKGRPLGAVLAPFFDGIPPFSLKHEWRVEERDCGTDAADRL